ncbi:MAG: hypothetical protein ABIJ61_11465 [bacterium]
MPILFKLIFTALLIAGVLWFVRLRLGLFVVLILLPGLVLGSVGVVFFAAAYLILASILLCTLLLLFAVVKTLRH